MIRRGPPPQGKGPRGLPHAGDRTPKNGIVPPELKLAYRELDALARDRRLPRVIRAVARAAGVVVHRLIMLIKTGAAREVEASGYLHNTIDTAARTSIALIESIDPLDTQPLSDGN